MQGTKKAEKLENTKTVYSGNKRALSSYQIPDIWELSSSSKKLRYCLCRQHYLLLLTTTTKNCDRFEEGLNRVMAFTANG